MGDFIYADVPWKTRSQEGYYKLYRQTFASRDYRRVYENIPTFHIYDDHEIINVSLTLPLVCGRVVPQLGRTRTRSRMTYYR